MSLSKVITVIPTFFDNFGSINYNLINDHIFSQINEGIKTIVLLGTTSEAPTISLEEKKKLVNYVYEIFGESIQIIIGLGGNNTNEMIEELKELERFCKTIMISQPYYNKPSQEGIYQHYKKLIESTNRNIIIYNIPSRCGVNIEPNTVKRISEISNRVIAIKEASGNLEQMMSIRELCPNLKLYSGDDALILPVLSIGGEGVISVVSNIYPKNMIEIINEFEKGDYITAQKLFYRIKPLIKYCFIESNPVPLKFILALTYNNSSLANVRLPLVELTHESKEKIYLCISNII